ncbi:MAG: HmuY family protein [Myxococcota bacterium]
MRFLPALLLLGCPEPGLDKGGDDTAASTLEPVCTEPEPPTCVDEMILDLSLHDDKVTEGEVTTETDGDDFVTSIDASAGGYSQAAENAWVYVRFGSDGAERIDIDDETALEDMTWHLALRRFIVRINSGDSGSSCVGAAAMIGFEYADITEVPEGITYLEDDYYTDDCTIINDSSGLPGSPQVAMGAWWSYSSCVETTETPMLLQLEDGRVIKLVIEKYYADEGQNQCNNRGSTDAESGFYQIRWAEL